MKIKFILMLLCVTVAGLAQTGDELRKSGKLDPAMYAYGKVFFQNPDDAENAYKLAATLALGQMQDTAFYFLKSALKNNHELMPLADSDFFVMSRDPRWSEIEREQMRKYQQKNGPLKDPEYALELLKMIMRDQAMDYYLDQAKAFYGEHGHAPHWLHPVSYIKGEINKVNYERMMLLLREKGWPTYSRVGDLAADAPLLVINHHPDDEVRKQYLPMIREACLGGEASCVEYAKIHDRVLANAGEPQDYGMQFEFRKGVLVPMEIKDPEYVDQRRAEIGLEPLKDYLKRRIDYDFKVAQKKR